VHTADYVNTTRCHQIIRWEQLIRFLLVTGAAQQGTLLLTSITTDVTSKHKSNRLNTVNPLTPNVAIGVQL